MPCRFSDRIVCREIVENIIPNLKNESELFPYLSHLSYFIGRCIDRKRANLETGSKQRCSFSFDDTKIRLFTQHVATSIGHLRQFSLGQSHCHARQSPDNLQRTRITATGKTFRKEEIAHQDRDMIVPNPVDRLLSTTFIAGVYHIVVHKRGIMKQFHSHGAIYCRGRHLPSQHFCRKQRHDWA